MLFAAQRLNWLQDDILRLADVIIKTQCKVELCRLRKTLSPNSPEYRAEIEHVKNLVIDQIVVSRALKEP